MNKKPAADEDSDIPPAPPKRRQCLRCGTGFESEWAGHRVCARCKSSGTWRNGVPISTLSSSRR